MATFLTLKEKILSFLAQIGVRKVDFFDLTGIQPSNFKGINIKSSPGGDMLVKILTSYPQLSAEWLMRGEGDMLRPSSNPFPTELTKSDPTIGENYVPPTAPIEQNNVTQHQEPPSISNSTLTELITTIREQAEEIGRLKAYIEQLEKEHRNNQVFPTTNIPKVETPSPPVLQDR